MFHLAILQSSHIFHETHVAGQDEPWLLKMPGKVVGDTAECPLEVLGGCGESALARRKHASSMRLGGIMRAGNLISPKQICFKKAGDKKACRAFT